MSESMPNKNINFKKVYRWTFELNHESLEQKSVNRYCKKIKMPEFLAKESRKKWGNMSVEFYDTPDNPIWNLILNKQFEEKCSGSINYYDSDGKAIDTLLLALRLSSISLSDLDYGENTESIIVAHFKVSGVSRTLEVIENQAEKVLWEGKTYEQI